MAIGEIHENDTTEFDVTIQDQNGNIVNLAGATTLNFLFQRPDGSFFTAAGSLFTDGTDGIVRYITLNTDLNQVGYWRYQVFTVIGSNENYTDITRFQVLQNIPIG